MVDRRANRGLHDKVVDTLGTLIAGGTYAETDQLVPESLAAEFGASRTVVREALRALQAKGMVLPRPKTGTRVLSIRHWNLLDPDVVRWRALSSQAAKQLNELSELREAIEVVAARLCAERATVDEARMLIELCDDMDATGPKGDLAGFTAADVRFHTLILNASGNAMFGNCTGLFEAFLHAREAFHGLPTVVDREVVDGHRLLARAISERDVERAEAACHALIEYGREETKAHLQRMPPMSSRR